MFAGGVWGRLSFEEVKGRDAIGDIKALVFPIESVPENAEDSDFGTAVIGNAVGALKTLTRPSFKRPVRKPRRWCQEGCGRGRE